MLSFLPFLRLAVARQRRRDWLVFAGYAAATVVVLTLVNAAPRNNPVAGALILVLMVAATAHALVEFRSLPSAAGSWRRAVPLSRPAPRWRRPADPVAAARARIERRAEARKIGRDDPVLARELRIGRPDLKRDYDDGGLIDVNAVPGQVLAEHLGFTEQEVQAVLAARGQLGSFSSQEEFSVYAGLPPARVDAAADLLWFG